MNADRLLEHYEQIADAPDAIARLRRFILDLAVRGKLVPQDPKDEPASELLKRIAAEKAQLDRRERTKREQRNLTGDTVPVPLPTGWASAPLADLVTVLNGRAYKQNELLSAGTPVLRVGNLFTSDRWYYSNLQLEEDKYCDKGDLIFAWSASFGPFIWSGEKVIYHYHIWKLPLHSETDLDKLFLYNFLLQKTREIKESGHGISMIHMTKEKMELIPVPLPPLAEQHRIVAKVDELMALCDRLEAARVEREATRDRLGASSLARLNAPDPQTFQADAHFVLNALPALTTRPDQIKQLRQTILNLAIRGKLVPQDPGDEPASDLLRKIHNERRHKRKFVQIDEGELENPLFDLPPKWVWATIDQISADDDNAITDGPFGSQLKTEHYIQEHGFRVIRLQNIGRGIFKEEHHSYVDRMRFERLSKHHVFPGDLVVAGLVDPSIRCCEVPVNIGPALVKADCYRFSVHPELSMRFALHFLNSLVAQEFAAIHNHGMTLTRIGLGNFRRIPIPVAPLAEQRRIVAKVDELFALCNRLEATLAVADDARRRLLDTLLAEALAPADALETAAAE